MGWFTPGGSEAVKVHYDESRPMIQSSSPGASRRNVLRYGAVAAAGVAASGLAAPSAVAAAPAQARRRPSGAGAELVLLGTAGGPPPWDSTGTRNGISSALTVGGKSYVVDVGHGTYGQFHQAGLTSMNGIFITHLHSDHIAELFTIPWLRHGGVKAIPGPIPIYGPGRAGGLPESRSSKASVVNPANPTPGTVDFIEKSIEAAAYDLNIRMRDEGWPDLREVLRPQDIELPDVGASPTGELYPAMEPFTVFEDDRVKVSAILVKHPPVFPAFGFRFDMDEGSVVFSGDTGACENTVRLAEGADYLVHEVIDLDWVGSSGDIPESIIDHLRESHTDVNEIGSIAEAAGVRNLVLTHIVPGSPQDISDGQWRRRAQRGYSGTVHVGRDLMTFGLERSRRGRRDRRG